jgi:putative peptide zinc metalloprotease protein
MFLVFAPVPYVDASGSSAFADKRQRALVAAAGMLTELFLAALALQVWLAVEPGMVRSLAFSVMVIGGVSTLLFNGNPLLRYDGYFVLCDLIESPNLAQRANQFWLWLVRRHAFGLRQAQPPRATPGERVWFTVYAPLAFAYRVAITCGIALFLGQEYLYVGMGIGLWGLATMLLWPLAKGLRYLASSPELSGRRARPVALAGGAMALLMAGLLAVPAPLATYAQGLVWPADNAQLRAAEAGFVERLAVLPGQSIHAGEAVLRMRNDGAQTDRDAAQARDERQRRGYIAALAGTGAERDLGHARVATEVRHQEWLRAADELDHARQTVDRLTVSARRDGRVELPRADDLPGRWLKKGELFGHLVTDDAPTVRVVVTQDDIALVRAGTGRIEVRLAGDPATVWIAQQRHEVPGGDDSLPAMALTLDGGGLIAADTRDPARPRALNRVFQFDLELPTAARAARIGERAHVRFVHADEPLAVQWARRLRQLLLSRLGL